MFINALVGTLSSERDIHSQAKNKETGEVIENFYLTSITIKGHKYPAIGSQFILKNISGKVKLRCFLETDRTTKEEGRLFTYLRVVSLIEVDSSTADDDSYELIGKIVQRRPLIYDRTLGDDKLLFVVNTRDNVQPFIAVHLLAVGTNARKLHSVPQLSKIHVKGSLVVNYEKISINVNDILSISERGNKKYESS